MTIKPLEGFVTEQQNAASDNLTEFLAALTSLAWKHRIGLNDECVLYELEADDFDRTFRVVNGDRLNFR